MPGDSSFAPYAPVGAKRTNMNGWWTPVLKDLRAQAIRLLRVFRAGGDSLSYQAYSIARAAFHKQCKAAKKLFLINREKISLVNIFFY